MTPSEIIGKIRVWGLAGVRNYLRDRYSLACVRRELNKMLLRRPATDPVPGVTVIADLSSGGSISKVMRDFISSLKTAGIPWQSFNTRRARHIDVEEYRPFVTPAGEFDIYRYSHVVEMFDSPLTRCPVVCRARIAFWEGEHGILDVWPYLDKGDVVVGMSDFNAAYFSRELRHSRSCKILYPLRPVAVNPLPVPEVRRSFGIGSRDFVVFFNFDLGSFHRKNPKAVIRAFALALGTKKDATLVLKVMGADAHPGFVDDLKREAVELGVADRLLIVTEYLSQDMLYGLTSACDVYISLHRGEGFGLGMAEAMLFGKPVIATDWSGNTEFCKKGSSFPIPCKLVPVRTGEFFTSMVEWAEPDIDEAARALLRCYEDPALRHEVGEKGRKFILDHFSSENFRRSVLAFLEMQ